MSVRFHRAQFENMESNHTNMASTLSFNGAIGREEPEQYLNAEMFFDLGSFVFDRKMSSSDKAEIILLKNPAGELVVTKKIHKKHFRKTEVALMKRVSGHERIIGYLGYQHPELGNDHHYIYMEYMRTDLYDFQDDPAFPNRMMPEDVIKTIFKQLVEGVDYLHTNHICHRDLKPENIFLNDATSVKIGDFGYATAFEPQQWFSKRIGTFGYTPPEVVTDMQHNFKVDIWALGVILFTLFNHINPFLLATPSNSNKRQYSKDVKRNIVLLRYEIAEGRDPPFLAFELIKFMLNPDPNLRPDITNVKGQRWLQASETTV